MTGLSLTQRSPTDFGVSECDREASKMRKPFPAMDCLAMEFVLSSSDIVLKMTEKSLILVKLKEFTKHIEKLAVL